MSFEYMFVDTENSWSVWKGTTYNYNNVCRYRFSKEIYERLPRMEENC